MIDFSSETTATEYTLKSSLSNTVTWEFQLWCFSNDSENVIVASFPWIFIVWQFQKSNKTLVSMFLYSDKDYSTSFGSLLHWLKKTLACGSGSLYAISGAEWRAIIFIRVQKHKTKVLLLNKISTSVWKTIIRTNIQKQTPITFWNNHRPILVWKYISRVRLLKTS